jgi:hypothetical protein
MRNQRLIDLVAESADRRRSVRQTSRTNTLCVRPTKVGLNISADANDCRYPFSLPLATRYPSYLVLKPFLHREYMDTDRLRRAHYFAVRFFPVKENN